jgi:uncharacterized protein YndB with AHSA1/START domain
MSQITVSIVVPADPAVVFEHLCEPVLMKTWMKGFVRAEVKGSDELGVGSRSTDVFEENGRTIKMETEITEFEPPRVLAASVAAPQLGMASRFVLEPTDGGTRITQTASNEWKLPYRLLSQVLNAGTKKRMAGDLERLRNVLRDD